MFLFYLRGREGKRERRVLIHWFLRMPTTCGIGPGCDRELELQSRFPVCMAGSFLPAGALAGS